MTVIRFPRPDVPLNLNHRDHWSVRAKRTKAWRRTAWAEAFSQVPPPRTQPRSLVTVSIPVVGNRRRDAANLSPTVKPIVDGLVDAGLWPDDTGEYVVTAEPVLVVGGTEVVVTLQAIEVAS